MLSGYDVICFAIRAWDSTWKNNQQLMWRLAAENRVLYVNPPRSLKSALAGGRRTPNGRATLIPTGRKIHLLQEPKTLPRWGKSHIVARLFNRVADPARVIYIKRRAQLLGFDKPILWIYDPLAAAGVGAFDEQLVIYHVADNYTDYAPPGDASLRAALAANHLRMLKQADVVFAVSESLRLQCAQVNPNSFLVPNAVDFEHFRTAASRSVPEMERLPPPIVGYVGVVHASTDVALLTQVATTRPQWSLVIVGPVQPLPGDDQVRFSHLMRLPNVYYFGNQHPDRLPAYIAHCDVTLMPYRSTPLTMHGDSLKLYEYLACGKPIVSTDIPSAHRFPGLVRIATDAAGFIQAIQDSLQEPAERAGERIREAEKHSWARRVESLSAILRTRLSGNLDQLQRTANPRSLST